MRARVLVSACLLGEKVRYNGTAAASDHPILSRWLAEGRVVSFCPELAGGLGVPRPAAEMRGGDGHAVLDAKAIVVTHTGADVTAGFLRGARQALAAARAHDVRVAVLKDGSPSCGSGWTYDGSFSGHRQSAPGVTAALLERHGIPVFSDSQWEDAARYLDGLET